MRNILNSRTAVVGLVVVGAVAVAAPTTAKAVYDAKNAHKVDGYHAVELNKASYGGATNFIDDFNNCAFTTIYSRTFTTPRAGYLFLDGTVDAERDFSNTNPGLLTTRLTVNGKAVSGTMSAHLDNDSTYADSVANNGARKVSKGTYKIAIQAQECSAGMAFIKRRQLTASYSPFGAVSTLGIVPKKVAKQVSPQR